MTSVGEARDAIGVIRPFILSARSLAAASEFPVPEK
jgi:hypothetical protein